MEAAFPSEHTKTFVSVTNNETASIPIFLSLFFHTTDFELTSMQYNFPD